MSAEAVRWDEVVQLDRRIKWSLAVAVLPFVTLTAELPFVWTAFHASGFELYGVMFVALGFVAAREWLFKLFSPLTYICFVIYQYHFFFDPGRPWHDPVQAPFWLAAVFAVACFGANILHGVLAFRAKRLPLPAALVELVGLPLGGGTLKQAIAVEQEAAQARENQAWKAQAGRQE